MAAEREVHMITNDSLGYNIWKVGENCESIEEGALQAGAGEIPSCQIFGPDNVLIAIMAIGPGITIHYRDKEIKVVKPN